jgi:hypothetical protein
MLYIKNEMFQYYIRLKWDIKYVLAFDMNYDWTWKIQKIWEYIQIWKWKSFLINKSILDINPVEYQKEKQFIDKWHFARFLDREFRYKYKSKVERLWNVLGKEIQEYLINNRFPTFENEEPNNEEREWLLISKKWKWVYRLLDWDIE